MGRWKRLAFVVGLMAVSVHSAGDELNLRQGSTVTVNGRAALVTVYDVLPYRETVFSKACVYDRYGNPKLAELRRRYELDKVVAPGETEFEKQLLLMRWVQTRFDYGDPVREVSPGQFTSLGGLRDALMILSLAKKEQRFFCVQYTAVLVSAAASMGWICRPIGYATDCWTEMWSNQYGRWVFFNPMVNWHWRDSAGNPIDTCTGMMLRRTSRPDDTDRPTSFLSYPYVDYYTNTNLMDITSGFGRAYRISIAENRGGFDRANLTQTDPKSDVIFPINQAALTFAEGTDGLLVSMRTMTPNFKTFKVRVDGGSWTDSGQSFLWRLHPGTNRLEAKSVNMFEVDGPVSAVVLEVSP